MAFTDHKLKFVIDADGKAARRELLDIDGLIGRMGSGLGSLAGPAAIGATAVAGIGAAFVAGTAALFSFTKQAADYGSEIYNASVKTGLGAETISALKLAADRTGVSLESVGTIVGRFSKVIGEAAQGSDEAKEKLTRLGIDPKQAIDDLDGSLAQAIKRIYEMESPIAKATAAQQLFGKAGTELLKVIDDTKGNLPGLIAEAKRLGITLTDEDARAADEFGDQMDVLKGQLRGVQFAIGRELMPVFMNMATEISGWLSANQSEIRSWGATFSDVLGMVGDSVRRELTDIRELYYFLAQFDKNLSHGELFNWDEYREGVDVRKEQDAFGREMGGYHRAAANFERENARYKASTSLKSRDGYLDEKADGKKPKMGAGGSGMRKFFEDELGAVITSFRRTPGARVAGSDRISKHGSGEAVDIRTKDRSLTDIFTITAKAIEKGYRLVDERNKRDQPHQHYEANSRRASDFLGAASYGGADRLAYLQKLDAERLGKATGEGGFQKFTEETVDDQKRKNEETLSIIRDGINQEIELYESRAETKLAVMERDAEAMMLTEEQLADRRMQTEEDVSEFKIKKLEEYAELFEVDSRERAQITQKIALELETIEQKRAKREGERHAAEQKRLKEKRESWNRYVEAIKAATDAQDEADAAAGRRRYEAGTVTGGTGISGAIGRGLGTELVPMFDEATNSMLTFQDRLAMVTADVNDFVGNAIGGMIDGLAQMGAAWFATGEFSAKAALQMLSATAFSIAGQAAIKAVFEAAEAAAAFARYDFYAGSMHVAAGQLYATVAVIAAGAGVGLGLASRAVGGGKGGGKGGSRDSSATSSANGGSRAQDLSPISRSSEDTYISGRRGEARAVAMAIDKLTKKIDGMRPGDVLVAGARQKKGFVANQFSEDVKSNSALGSKAARSIGLR
jgi:hypothetical protein